MWWSPLIIFLTNSTPSTLNSFPHTPRGDTIASMIGFVIEFVKDSFAIHVPPLAFFFPEKFNVKVW
jgi:hypothetical protein